MKFTMYVTLLTVTLKGGPDNKCHSLIEWLKISQIKWHFDWIRIFTWVISVLWSKIDFEFDQDEELAMWWFFSSILCRLRRKTTLSSLVDLINGPVEVYENAACDRICRVLYANFYGMMPSLCHLLYVLVLWWRALLIFEYLQILIQSKSQDEAHFWN